MTSNQRRAIKRGVREAIKRKEAGYCQEGSIAHWAVVIAQLRAKSGPTGWLVYLAIYEEAKKYAENLAAV